MRNVGKLLKLAKEFDVQLKEYRKENDSNRVEELLEKALSDHKGSNVDVSYNNQHYGWFVWDESEDIHNQVDLNDFEASDTLKEVRNLVHGLDKKINLEDYE